jgi:hypothetical protein
MGRFQSLATDRKRPIATGRFEGGGDQEQISSQAETAGVPSRHVRRADEASMPWHPIVPVRQTTPLIARPTMC